MNDIILEDTIERLKKISIPTQKCKKCGKPISENTFNFYNGYCTECVKKEEEKTKFQDKVNLYLKKIPPKYQNSLNKNLDKYLHKNLFIHGKCSTGKTVLALDILRKQIKQGLWGKYIKFTHLLNELQYSVIEERYEKLKSIIEYNYCLVIDDFGGIGKITDFVKQICYDILDYREQYLLQTILTSNLNLSEIAETMGIRISERILRICSKENIIRLDKKY